MLKEAVILAGGFGTRLQSVVSDVPKPLAPVNDKPFLSYILSYLNFFGIEQVVLSTGYLADKIIDYYGDEFLGMRISYTKEHNPLGTGGGIRLALEKCTTRNVLVVNGDSFFDIDLHAYFAKHTECSSEVSLALRSVADSSRYGTLHCSDDGKITAFQEKSGRQESGLINGGVYIINRNLFLNLTEPEKSFSIEKDFYEKRIHELKIYGYEFDGYFIDIGIPEDYKRVQHDFKNFKYLRMN